MMTTKTLPTDTRILGRLDTPAQMETATLLQELAEEFPDLQVFHNLILPGTNVPIHHLLVHGGNIILIGDKTWQDGGAYTLTDQLEGDVNRVSQFSCIVLHEGEPFPGNFLLIRRYGLQTGMWLPDYTVQACLIAVHNDADIVDNEDRYNFKFLHVSALATQLRALLVVTNSAPTEHKETLTRLHAAATTASRQPAAVASDVMMVPKTAASFKVTPGLVASAPMPASLRQVVAAPVEKAPRGLQRFKEFVNNLFD